MHTRTHTHASTHPSVLPTMVDRYFNGFVALVHKGQGRSNVVLNMVNHLSLQTIVVVNGRRGKRGGQMAEGGKGGQGRGGREGEGREEEGRGGEELGGERMRDKGKETQISGT